MKKTETNQRVKKKELRKPKLPEGEKKINVVFRTLPSKKAHYQEKADNLFGGNLTRYIEYTLEDKPNHTIAVKTSNEQVDRAVFYSMVREINKIGANLNQLTRKANMGHFVNDKLEKTLADLSSKKEFIIELLVSKLDENTPNN